MPRQSTADILSPRSIRIALRAFDKPEALGLHALCDLRVVESHRRANNYANTPLGRATAGREILKQAIAALRSNSGITADAAQLRAHTILQQQYLERRSPVLIATELFLERSTYHNEQNRALGRLSLVLTALENAAEAQQTPQPGAPTIAIPFMAPPRPPYAIIGRDDVRATLKAALRDPNGPPYLAISGLPGAGKTALAISLANDTSVLARFDDGVLWAGVGRMADTLAILGAWAAALQVSFDVIERASTIEKRAQLVHGAIGMRKMLLVIDDVWQAGDAAVFRIGGPNCRHILTTRFQKIAFEFAGAHALTVKELSETASTELLSQFAPDAIATAPDEVAALLNSVGHLPLAITLIGRYLREHVAGGSPRRLQNALKRLGETQQRLSLSQTQSPLQRSDEDPQSALISLERVIQLSTESLDEQAREALSALSVFPPKPNSFSEDAACAAANIAPEVLDTLDDSGLIEVSGNRYQLHQTIADFARVRRMSDAPYGRLASFYQNTLATGAASEWIDSEITNILHVLETAHNEPSTKALAIAIANHLFRYFDERDLFSSADRVYRRATALADEVGDPALRANTALNLAYFDIKLGRFEDAGARVDALLENRKAGAPDLLRDDKIRATALIRGGTVAMARQTLELAHARFAQGLQLADQQQWHELQLEGRYFQGTALRLMGRYAEAEETYKCGLTLADSLHRTVHSARFLYQLGLLLTRRGDLIAADAINRRGLALARTANNAVRQCLLLGNLAEIALTRGDYARADDYAKQSLTLSAGIENPEARVMALHFLAQSALARGDYAASEQFLNDGLDAVRDYKSGYHFNAMLLDTQGELMLKTGEHTRAQQAFDALLSLARETQDIDYIASARFGQARLAIRADINQARMLGRESLSLYEQSGASRAAVVRAWLSEKNI